jgi:hypothetical protein
VIDGVILPPNFRTKGSSKSNQKNGKSGVVAGVVIALVVVGVLLFVLLRQRGNKRAKFDTNYANGGTETFSNPLNMGVSHA